MVEVVNILESQTGIALYPVYTREIAKVFEPESSDVMKEYLERFLKAVLGDKSVSRLF